MSEVSIRAPSVQAVACWTVTSSQIWPKATLGVLLLPSLDERSAFSMTQLARRASGKIKVLLDAKLRSLRVFAGIRTKFVRVLKTIKNIKIAPEPGARWIEVHHPDDLVQQVK